MELFDDYFRPVAASVADERELWYESRGIPVGLSWELRYWYPSHVEIDGSLPPAPPAPRLEQVSPSMWGSRVDYDEWTYGPWNPDKWVVHWGGGYNRAAVVPYNQDTEMGVLRGWEAYHLRKGWRGIAYNYAIGMTGNLYRLRGENRSAATSGDSEPDGIPENQEARAVVFIMGLGQQPSPAALRTFSAFWRQDGRPVIVHSDVKATACPGPDLREWVHANGFVTVT